MSNEVTLLIDGKDFKYWDDLSISRPLDSLSTFSMTAPFDPDVPLLRAAFEPFSYKSVVLKVDGDLIFTGVMFVLPVVTGKSVTVTCSGYSKPGPLNDCEFPQDSYPLEFNEVTLQTIADTAAQPFGVSVVFDDPPGTAFEQVAARSDVKILSFLIKLAKQRGLLISDTPAGALRFFKPIESGVAVASIRQDQARFISARPLFTDQQYFSSITGLSPNVIARFSEAFTVNNTFLSDEVRPHTFTISDTTDVDIQEVVKAKMGRMFAGAISYEVTVQGWRDDLGDVWAPNKIVKLLAPGIMVYTETEFVIKSAQLKRKAEGGDTVTLTLVLPGAYNGKIPEVLPWPVS